MCGCSKLRDISSKRTNWELEVTSCQLPVTSSLTLFRCFAEVFTFQASAHVANDRGEDGRELSRLRLEFQACCIGIVIQVADAQLKQPDARFLGFPQCDSHLRQKVSVARRVVRFDPVVRRTVCRPHEILPDSLTGSVREVLWTAVIDVRAELNRTCVKGEGSFAFG